MIRGAACLAAAAFVVGCGSDDAGDRTQELRSGDIAVYDWARAGVGLRCLTEAAAKRATGRTAVAAATSTAPEGCWLALATRPIAGTGDVERISAGDDGTAEVSFDERTTARLRALGGGAHVGLTVGDRLVAVVHPGGGRVLVPAARR